MSSTKNRPRSGSNTSSVLTSQGCYYLNLTGPRFCVCHRTFTPMLYFANLILSSDRLPASVISYGRLPRPLPDAQLCYFLLPDSFLLSITAVYSLLCSFYLQMTRFRHTPPAHILDIKGHHYQM